MTDKKPKRPTYTTPVGIARFPHLNKPDTKFKADGEYKCDVRLKADDEAVQALIARLETLRDEKLAEFEANEKGPKDKIAVADVFIPEVDDEGNDTGYVILRTKLNAVGTDKKTGESWKNEPKLFDAEGNPLPKAVAVWSGSKIIVAGTIATYAFVKKGKKPGPREIEVGVSLKCRGVQVIELVSGSGQTAESFGFKKQSGYKAPTAEAGIGSNDDDADASDATASADADGDEF